ncbi:MFS transporter [Phenylobacterium sp.]|uniref:MFS transporter n=1 Tax=Phenylobacterium sp. TaxID=1871053 RepID=UPI002735D2F4|nr:MFS transporter [Phenylobacterium sp.]MDP3855853.1 MFS transporter [Phenylobacterium sp.]
MTQASKPRSGPLPLSTALAFAATSLPISAVAIAVSVYLPRHYASHLGVDLALVGAAFFIVRMIDIPIDGLLGWTMDKTRTAWGRYRVWTMLGAPILMAGIFFLFMPPEGVGRSYLILWLLIMYLGNSILTLSHVAWAATLAPHYDDRSRLFGIMTGIGVLGAASVLAIPIVNEAIGASDAGNVATMGWFIFLLTPVAAALVVWRTPERIAPEVAGHQFRLRDYWALVARPSFARILLADLCLSLGPGWMSALYLFFFTDSRGFTTGQASILLAVYILAGFVGAPLMGRLATRMSKHRATMVATTGYSLTLVSLMAIPQGNMAIGVIPMFVAGFFAAGFNVLTRAMTADVADEVRLEQGKERAGLLYAMTVMTTKIAGAFSIGLTFFVLSQVGYIAKEGVTNTPDAIRNLEFAYLIGPVVFVMLGGACMIGYKLGSERHADIRRQLDERDALYDEAPIIESVTTEAAVAVPPTGR